MNLSTTAGALAVMAGVALAQKQKRTVCRALSVLVFSSAVCAAAPQAANAPWLAFTHVNVIDVAGAREQKDVTVLIRDGRIHRIGSSPSLRIPRSAQVINARGKFLIPGLWDMHAHPLLTQDSFFPGFVLALYVANGVTGIRDMFGPVEQKKEWRKAINERLVVGPRMTLAGPLLDGPTSHIPGAILINNENEARQAIRSMKERGADFAKVHETLSRESYFAVADEAKQLNFPFDGHVPASVTAFEASDAGQRSIEHLTNVAVGCSSLRESLQSQWSTALLASDNATGLRDLARTEAQGLLNFDEQNCRELAARFVTNKTWQDPTLVVLRVVAFGNSRALADDPRLRYIPASIRKSWAVDKSALWRAFTPEDFLLAQKAFPIFLKIVGLMHRAGVKFLAGTDPPVPYCLPGFSIHDELSLFVDAGLSPAEALRTATMNPAEFLGTLGETGTVEAGKTADLVLLDANPLEDIANTRKISGVVLRGDYLSRWMLDQMLAKVRSAVNRD